MLLYLDIETIPMNEEISEDDLRAVLPGNIKAEKTINEWLSNKRDELEAKVVKKRSIDRYQCKAIAIAYAFEDSDITYLIDDDEESLILKFNEALSEFLNETGGSSNKFQVVGHNVKKFDLPILFLRASKYGAQELHDLLFFNRKGVIDTMEMGTYWMYNEHVSLKNLCKYFGRDTKEDIDGSKVYIYYKDGKLEDIGKYCAKDVEDTRFVYKKLHVY